MLLLAPQSGKKTRTQIQRKSIELRDQTTEAVEDAVAQAGVKARQITADVHEQAEAATATRSGYARRAKEACVHSRRSWENGSPRFPSLTIRRLYHWIEVKMSDRQISEGGFSWS